MKSDTPSLLKREVAFWLRTYVVILVIGTILALVSMWASGGPL